MATIEDNVSFKSMDDRISAYYQEMGRNDYRMDDGDGLFLDYCNEEAFDIDDLKEDLFGDAEESQLLEFDENFPLTNENQNNNKKQEVQKILIKLYNECTANSKAEAPSNDQIFIKQMDDLINEYYKKMNVDSYEQTFLKYCETQGHTIDNLNDEFDDDNDVENCEYVLEFLEEFPLGDCVNDDRPNAIFEILKDIYNQTKSPNKYAQHIDNDDEKKYNNTIHKTFQYFKPFDVVEKTRKEIKKLYEDAFFVRTTANDNQESDRTLIDWLTIGYQNNYPTFVMNLSAACARDKLYYEIEHNKVINTEQWIQSKSSLKNNLSMSQQNRLKHAIDAYVLRTCTPLEVNEMLKINDSLKQICIYVAIVSRFIRSLVMTGGSRFGTLGHSVTPFQLDFMIAVNGTKTVDNMVLLPGSSIDDVDEYEDYDDHQHHRQIKKLATSQKSQEIGNITDKLNANNCFYIFDKKTIHDIIHMKCMHQYEANEIRSAVIQGTQYCFGPIYKKFKSKLYCNESHINAESYPRNRRVCFFLDRRHNDTDTLTIFDPPNNCNKLSENEEKRIPESFFTNLHKCLIPSMEYNKDVKNDVETIRMKSACDGNLMTFSFHVEQRDEIRCYFIWNGRCIRFCPNDMFGFLPIFFNMNYGQNQVFASSQEIRTIASSTLIEDVAFDTFYTSL